MQPRILIVDDSPTVRADLQQALKLAGFMATSCDSVKSARAALAIGFFTLVILEVVLPDGDGIDLLGSLRRSKATSSLPVILLSSESTVRSRVRGLTAGASDYIGKPYDSGYIVKRARELSRGFELARLSSADASSAAKVLVVDDSPTFSVSMVNQLRQDGHDVIIATTGEEALELLKVQRVDCVILDVQMPGIGGLETCRRIKLSPLHNIPVLMVTASESAASQSLALAAGADDFIAKASKLELLRVRLRIRHLLRRAAMPPPPSSSPGDDAPPSSTRRRAMADAPPPSTGRRAIPDAPPSSTGRRAIPDAPPSSTGRRPTAAETAAPPPMRRPTAAETAAPPPMRRLASQESDVPPSAARWPSPSYRGVSGPPPRDGRSEMPPASASLLDRIVAVSGLSSLAGSVVIQRAYGHAGVDPERLARAQVVPLLASIRRALAVFMTGGVLEERLEAIEGLVRDSARASIPDR